MAAKKKKSSTKKKPAAKPQATKSPAKKNVAKKKAAPKKVAAPPKAKKKAGGSPKKAAPPARANAASPKKSAAPPKKSAAPAKKSAAAPKTKAAGSTAPRRDATGHLNPEYAKKLRDASREFRDDSDNDRAFLRKSRSHDTLAEELGEDAVAAMTSGEDQSDKLQDEEVEEERGGPFVVTTPRQEYAVGTDASNPSDATREPFPKT